MSDKRSLYKEEDIMTLEFDDGAVFDVGIMGIFDVDGAEYIALDSLDESNNDVYLYRYVTTENDFELVDIPEEDFDRISEVFDKLMDEME